jgi:hypothetical protein
MIQDEIRHINRRGAKGAELIVFFHLPLRRRQMKTTMLSATRQYFGFTRKGWYLFLFGLSPKRNKKKFSANSAARMSAANGR